MKDLQVFRNNFRSCLHSMDLFIKYFIDVIGQDFLFGCFLSNWVAQQALDLEGYGQKAEVEK